MVFLINLLQRYPLPCKPNVTMEVYMEYDKPTRYLSRRKVIELVLPEVDISSGRQNFVKRISEMTK